MLPDREVYLQEFTAGALFRDCMQNVNMRVHATALHFTEEAFTLLNHNQSLSVTDWKSPLCVRLCRDTQQESLRAACAAPFRTLHSSRYTAWYVTCLCRYSILYRSWSVFFFRICTGSLFVAFSGQHLPAGTAGVASLYTI